MKVTRVEPEVHEIVPGYLLEKSEWALADDDGTVINEIWYEGYSQIFTEEEIAASDKKFLASNDEVLDEIIADGFIRYPLWFNDFEGNLVEREAYLPPTFEPSCTEGFYERHRMATNIYIPSYERAGIAPTMKMFDDFGVENYYICIDPQQYPKYKEHYPRERIIIRDIRFREEATMEPMSSLRRPMNMAGHSPLCNFTLALSRSLGEEYFTFADDDFMGLAMKAVKGDEIFKATEVYEKERFYRCSKLGEQYGFDFQEFWGRLENLMTTLRNPGFLGLEKFGTVFCLPISFKRGTRVYSLYITKNETQVEHMGVQNNDVITSIELSKHGLVNLIQEGICYNSEPTQKGDGGQAVLYKTVGTFDKGKVLVRAQPNYMKIVERYSRIHHLGDFNWYNKQRLVGTPLRDGETCSPAVEQANTAKE